MKIRFYISMLSILFGILCPVSDSAAELRIDSVYPTMGIKGQDLPITIKGSGFDANTKITVYPDTGNRKSIIGSVQISARQFVLIGKTALALSGKTLQIIDINDLYNPKIVGYIDIAQGAYDITAFGNFVYLAKDSSLQIIDISDIYHPKIVSSVGLTAPVSYITLAGTTAYLGGSNGSNTDLQIVDVTNPYAPKVLCSINTPGRACAIVIVGNIAYLSDKNNLLSSSEFQVVDISNPCELKIIGSVKIPRDALNITMNGNTAYVADELGGFQIIDVSIPSAPRIIGYLPAEESVSKVVVKNNRAYISDGLNFHVIDISDPSKPVNIGTIYTDGAYDIKIVENIAYITTRGNFSVIDLNAITNTEIIGSVDLPGKAYHIENIGNKVYVSHSHTGDMNDDINGGGFRIIDVSIPSAPNVIGYIDYAGRTEDFQLIGNTVYATALYDGLKIIDVSLPSAPKILGSVDTPSYARGVCVKGNIAYIADWNSGLQIVDISDSSVPKIIGSMLTPCKNARDVTVIGNTAYVADGCELVAIDVSIPSNPKIIQFPYIFGVLGAYGVTSVGNILYLSDPNKLHIIDAGNPLNLKLISSVIVPCTGGSTLIGNKLYVSSKGNINSVIDVSNPYYPVIIGTIDTHGVTYGIGVIDNVAFVASGVKDMLMVPVPIEVKPSLINSTTLSITIPRPPISGNYTIRVFNNNNESSELLGAVTFVPPEDSYLLDTKAIIVVGTKSDDGIKQNTAQAGAQAYRTLLYQGYTAESIYYLAPDISEGVDARATKDNISFAINTWAKQNPAATELLIYLVDHGEPEGFHINESETLTAQELSQWLNDLQNSPNIPVTLVYDACRSGSFLSKLSPPPAGKERIVMTSTLPTQDAVIGYNLSFSYYFWDGIFNGKELGNAFEYARNQSPTQQTPQIDSNGNGKGNEPEDMTIAIGKKLRRGYKPQTDVPYIYDFSPPQVIHNETAATLKAGVSCVKDGTAVRRVWAVITPPDFFPDSPNTPISDLPTRELTDPDNDGIFEGFYDKFFKNGMYEIQICAMNTQGGYALFRRTAVTKASDYISDTTPVKELYGGDTSALLWASLMPNINIRKVWAEIIPPVIGAPVDTLELPDPETDRVYQAVYDKFTYPGAYTVNFYATDTEGYTTPANRTTVTRMGYTDADISEPDSNFDIARLYDKQKMPHNFHAPGDADWIKFSAVAGKSYTVRTKNPSLSCDTVIGLYKISDGKPVMLTEAINKNGAGQGESLEWTCPAKGYYYVRVANADPQIFGNNIRYDFEIYQPIAGSVGIVRGTITDTSGKAVSDAMISTSGSSALSMENGAFSMDHPTGNYTLSIEADGYLSYETSVTVAENQTVTKNIMLIPIHVYKGDVSGDGNIDLKDVILGLRVVSGISNAIRTVRSEADVNGDGRIGLEEVIYILQKVAVLR